MDFEVSKKGFLKEVKLKKQQDVIIPNDVVVIGDRVLCNAPIKSVIFGENVKKIGFYSFSNCENLENIKFGPMLETIGGGSFSFCGSIKSVDFPSNLKRISKNAFLECKNLQDVFFPFNIEYIGDTAFQGCKIKSIDIPDSVNFLGEAAFRDCKSLVRVNLSDSIKVLNETFCGCHNLQNINLPKNLEIIKMWTFNECFNLEKVEFPNTVKRIEMEAFKSCSKLKEITLPSSLEFVGVDAFAKCTNLDKIVLNNYSNLFQEGICKILSRFSNVYLNIKNDELVISKKTLNDQDEYQEIDYKKYKEYLNCDDAEAICCALLYKMEELKDPKLEYIRPLLKYIVKHNMRKEKYLSLKESLNNNDEFNSYMHEIYKTIKSKNNETSFYNIFKFAYSIGAFSEDKNDREKAINFMKNEKNNRVFDVFKYTNIKLYDKEWANFIMSEGVFEELLNLEKQKKGFIARAYNYLENVKHLCILNKEEISVDFLNKHIYEVIFDGINESNLDIVEVISRFSDDQEVFDEACNIRKIYLKHKEKGELEDHILGKRLSSDLNEDSLFTWEFLSKSHAANFGLGRYCSCDSYIGGRDYGEMIESILNPDCQNMIIRNERGRIIAKSTLYINRDKGYGILNGIQLNSKISEDEKKYVYEKCKIAIDSFVSEYNKQNKENPLKKINVGMTNNDLENYIRKNDASAFPMEGLYFSEHDKFGRPYIENWEKSQYIFWSNMVNKGRKR